MVAKNQLPKFVRIQTIYLGAHSNATHTLFHSNQYELVAKVEQTKLNIPAELLASWKAGIDMEVEINKQSAAHRRLRTAGGAGGGVAQVRRQSYRSRRRA